MQSVHEKNPLGFLFGNSGCKSKPKNLEKMLVTAKFHLYIYIWIGLNADGKLGVVTSITSSQNQKVFNSRGSSRKWLQLQVK